MDIQTSVCAGVCVYCMLLCTCIGMSESCGPQTFNVDTFKGKWRTGSCGPLVIGAHLKIDKPSEEGEGEVME